MSEKSSVGQVEKIKKLIKTATNPKQKAMYQDLLTKLQSELGSQASVQEKSTNPTQQNSQPGLAPKPHVRTSPPQSSSKKSHNTKRAKGSASTRKSTSKQIQSESKIPDVASEKVNQSLKSNPDNSTAQQVQQPNSSVETSPSVDEKVQDSPLKSVEVKESTSSVETPSQTVEAKDSISSDSTSSKLVESQESISSDSTSQTVAKEAQVKQGYSETSQTEKEKPSDKIKAESEETKDKNSGDESESSSDDEPENLYYFQGIGIIKGEVKLTEERSTIKMGGKEYRLFYIPNRRKKAFEALKREIAQTQNQTQRLIVYPRILHLPKKDQPHQVSFQVVGFIGSKSKPTQLNEELGDFEFKFSGLWQFIPVCRTPCISIFRNFNKERLAWIKEANPAKKVKFMKASHVPLLWRDSPVKPFRFNPKLEKEQQGQTYFVQIKAKFLPGRDVFGFVEQLEEPTEDVPGFLKASKKLKAEALKEVKDRQKQQSQSPDKSEVKPVREASPKEIENSEAKPNNNLENQPENQQETKPPKKSKRKKKKKKSPTKQQENSQIQQPNSEQQENSQLEQPNPEQQENSQVEPQDNSQVEQQNLLQVEQPDDSQVQQQNSKQQKNSQVQQQENSQIQQQENSQVQEPSPSQVEQQDNSQVQESNSSPVEKQDNSQVEPQDNSQVQQQENSQVKEPNSSPVEQQKPSQVEQQDNSQTKHQENSRVQQQNPEQQDSF